MDRDEVNQIYVMAKWVNRDKGEEISARLAVGAVRNALRKEDAECAVLYCKVCNKFYPYRGKTCIHYSNIEVMSRHVPIKDSLSYDNEFEDKVMVRIFIQSMRGVLRRVADELLQKRLIYSRDHVRYLATLLHVSERTVRVYIRKVRALASQYFVGGRLRTF